MAFRSAYQGTPNHLKQRLPQKNQITKQSKQKKVLLAWMSSPFSIFISYSPSLRLFCAVLFHNDCVNYSTHILAITQFDFSSAKLQIT